MAKPGLNPDMDVTEIAYPDQEKKRRFEEWMGNRFQSEARSCNSGASRRFESSGKFAKLEAVVDNLTERNKRWLYLIKLKDSTEEVRAIIGSTGVGSLVGLAVGTITGNIPEEVERGAVYGAFFGGVSEFFQYHLLKNISKGAGMFRYLSERTAPMRGNFLGRFIYDMETATTIAEEKMIKITDPKERARFYTLRTIQEYDPSRETKKIRGKNVANSVKYGVIFYGGPGLICRILSTIPTVQDVNLNIVTSIGIVNAFARNLVNTHTYNRELKNSHVLFDDIVSDINPLERKKFVGGLVRRWYEK